MSNMTTPRLWLPNVVRDWPNRCAADLTTCERGERKTNWQAGLPSGGRPHPEASCRGIARSRNSLGAIDRPNKAWFNCELRGKCNSEWRGTSRYGGVSTLYEMNQPVNNHRPDLLSLRPQFAFGGSSMRFVPTGVCQPVLTNVTEMAILSVGVPFPPGDRLEQVIASRRSSV